MNIELTQEDLDMLESALGWAETGASEFVGVSLTSAQEKELLADIEKLRAKFGLPRPA